jgi:hypothetical protein
MPCRKKQLSHNVEILKKFPGLKKENAGRGSRPGSNRGYSG